MLRRILLIAVVAASSATSNVSGQIAPPAVAEAPRSLIERSPAAIAFRRVPSTNLAVLAARSDTVRRPSLDLLIAARLRSSGVQQSGGVRAAARVFDTAAIPGTFLLAAALYGAGEIQNDPQLSDLGLHTGQAIVAAGTVSLAGKVIVGRARPRISPDDAHDVSFGRGLRGNPYQSFPSAHTAVAFATAAVMASDLPDRIEGSSGWVAPLAYGGATLSAVSRLYYDEHWATDLIAGAILGTLMGLGFSN